MRKPPAKKVKKPRRRKPGLWFAARRIEIEGVKKAHKVVCCVCEKKPIKLRLVVKDGSARAQTTRVFCAKCGKLFADRMKQEADRAWVLLAVGFGEVRLEENGSGDLGQEFIKRKAAERAERKAAKAAAADS